MKTHEIRKQFVIAIALLASLLWVACSPKLFVVKEHKEHPVNVLDSVLVANSLPSLQSWRERFLQYSDRRINPYFVWIAPDEKHPKETGAIYTVEMTDSTFVFINRSLQ